VSSRGWQFTRIHVNSYWIKLRSLSVRAETVSAPSIRPFTGLSLQLDLLFPVPLDSSPLRGLQLDLLSSVPPERAELYLLAERYIRTTSVKWGHVIEWTSGSTSTRESSWKIKESLPQSATVAAVGVSLVESINVRALIVPVSHIYNLPRSAPHSVPPTRNWTSATNRTISPCHSLGGAIQTALFISNNYFNILCRSIWSAIQRMPLAIVERVPRNARRYQDDVISTTFIIYIYIYIYIVWSTIRAPFMTNDFISKGRFIPSITVHLCVTANAALQRKQLQTLSGHTALRHLHDSSAHDAKLLEPVHRRSKRP